MPSNSRFSLIAPGLPLTGIGERDETQLPSAQRGSIEDMRKISPPPEGPLGPTVLRRRHALG